MTKKKKGGAKKNLRPRSFRLLVRFIIVGAGVLALLGGTAVFFLWPRPVWLVEARFLKTWERVLAGYPAPLGEGVLGKARVLPLETGETVAGGDLPKALRGGNYYGYRITGGPGQGGSPGGGGVVRVYRGLNRPNPDREILPLALDPWLVFHKYDDSPLVRSRLANSGDGLLLFPGGEREAVTAWTAQLLQETPGVFSPAGERWDNAAEWLFSSRAFQPGAQTYGWREIWPFLLEDQPGEVPVWVYAPLSRIRAMPLHETNILEADAFPSPGGGTDFGIQAEILWAAPFGKFPARKKKAQTVGWLQDVRTQTLLADTLGWLAVHPDAPPYNPVSASARVIWLTSSFVWIMSGEPRPSAYP